MPIGLKIRISDVGYSGLVIGGEESEADGGDGAEECGDMVPVEFFAGEEERSAQGEDGEGDDLPDDFELEEGIATAVSGVAYAVGGDHKAVFATAARRSGIQALGSTARGEIRWMPPMR